MKGNIKMKVLRKVLIITLSLSIFLTSIFALLNNYTQNVSGRYSSVTTITKDEREWIMERFGREYESIEEYIITVQDYASEKFRYDYDKSIILQHYNFKDIENGDMINGICFDFAVLFKHITLVLDEEGLLPEENVKVFVTDIRYKKRFFTTHSYNVITLKNGDNYYLDLTDTATSGEKGQKPKEYFEKFDSSIKEYADNNGEILYGLH